MAERPNLRSPEFPFFEIRIPAVATNQPLPYDLYLLVGGKHVLFRKRGDVVTTDRAQALLKHGGNVFLVPKDQRDEFQKTMKKFIKDPSTTSEVKSRFIKESAFIHVHDLFTQDDIGPVIKEAESLVEDMVDFITSDLAAVSSLMRLSIHDYYTYNHSVDVAVYSIALAKRFFGNNQHLLITAGMGGLLHDIGKRNINWNIINKSGPLTPEEWEEIKSHPTYGKIYLEDNDHVPEDSKCAVHQHHENFNGTGYPQGLKEDEIHRLSRIVSIADVFDALTTDRSYQKAVTPQEAIDTMFSLQPGKFDPDIFKSFNNNFANKKAPIELPDHFDPCQPQDLKKHKK